MKKTPTGMEGKQRIYTFNIALVIAALALASIIGILILPSLSIPTINAQASSSGPTSDGIIGSSSSSSGDSGTNKQMGVCVVGVESPCNG
jgi:hypothetical protein